MDANDLARNLLAAVKPPPRDKLRYSKAIAEKICDRIADGATLEESLNAEAPDSPTLKRWWKWMAMFPKLREQYDLSRRIQADMLADRHLAFAQAAVDDNDPKRASCYKVAAEILRWQAQMQKPETYSPRAKIETPKKKLSQPEILDEIAKLQRQLGIDQPAPEKDDPPLPSVPHFNLPRSMQ